MSLRWREFRIRILPAIVFIVTALVVGWLWTHSLGPVHFVGVATGKTYTLNLPTDGQISRILVKRSQSVSAGDPILEILPATSQLKTATLNRIQAETRQLSLSMEPMSDLQRNALNLEQVLLDQVNTRVERAQAQANAFRALRELERVQNLHEQGIASTSDLDLAKATYEAFQVEVDEKSNYLRALELRIEKLKSAGGPESSWQSALQSSLEVKQAELAEIEATMSPVMLFAPGDGVVKKINVFEGQWARAGELGVEIVNPRADHVVGYMREPFSETLAPGDQVEIRTRRTPPTSALTTVESIGPELSIIPANLTASANLAPDARGLTVYIPIPPELNAIPGETISVNLLAESQK